MTRRVVLQLIADYLRLPPGNASAREAWARKVREAFPYQCDILTAPIGDHLFRSTPPVDMAAKRARMPQEAGEIGDRMDHMRTVLHRACRANEARVAC